MNDFEVHPVGTGNKLAKFEKRLCVNCGRHVDASHDRSESLKGCPSPDACTFDMTMEEALQHWRVKAHQERERADNLAALLKSDDAITGYKKVRHVKRGSEYMVIGHGKIQTDKPLSDYHEVIVYVGENGSLWVRPVSEFMDGRFENL